MRQWMMVFEDCRKPGKTHKEWVPPCLRLRSFLYPELSIKCPILNGFRNMFALNLFGAGQIGDGARNLENAIVSPACLPWPSWRGRITPFTSF